MTAVALARGGHGGGSCPPNNFGIDFYNRANLMRKRRAWGEGG